MKRLLFLTFLVISLSGFSQTSFTIKGEIDSFPGGMVQIASFFGEFTDVFDSTEVKPDGKLEFIMTKEQLPGYYRIVMDKEKYIDLIYNNENIVFSSDFNAPFDSLEFQSSTENQLYYDFVEFLGPNQLELDILNPLTGIYPETSPLYPGIIERFEEVQQERADYINDITKKYPDAYATRVLKTQRRPWLTSEMTEQERLEHLKLYYWDEIDLTDTELLRSNVYPNLIIEYLSMYGNRNFTQEQLEASFITCVDMILGAAMDNEQIYSYFLEYLVHGFERYHFDKVLDHIAVNYAYEEMCENENLDEEVVRRLKNYQNLSIGKPAPNIVFDNLAGSDNDLYSINNQFVLIVFWASWCPHCNEILPEIKTLYETLKMDIEVVAVSIDKEKAEYDAALAEGEYPWINYCDYSGWDSKPAKDFNVYATPTMFLLDMEKTIIAKPITYNELVSELEKL